MRPEVEDAVSLEQITERLREIVRHNGGQSKVARAAGVPVSTVSDYLGGMEMRISRAAKIASACGVTLDWLAFGTRPEKTATSFGLSELGNELLDSAANFWALYISIRSAQFYFEQVGFTPSLRDTLIWIREPYRQALDAPDRPIELKGISSND